LRLGFQRNDRLKQIKLMRNLKVILLALGCIAMLGFGSATVQAQGRGNFDPAQFRQMILDNYKDTLGVTDDAEWKVIEDALGKVVDARAAVMAGSIRNFRGNRGGRNRDGNTNSTSDDSNRRRRGGFGPEPGPAAADLQKAIDDKAPADEIKGKLAKLREENAANDAKLTAAQEDLKKLVTARQEAVLVLGGMLK
jgi:hypothetical protein